MGFKLATPESAVRRAMRPGNNILFCILTFAETHCSIFRQLLKQNSHYQNATSFNAINVSYISQMQEHYILQNAGGKSLCVICGYEIRISDSAFTQSDQSLHYQFQEPLGNVDYINVQRTPWSDWFRPSRFTHGIQVHSAMAPAICIKHSKTEAVDCDGGWW